MEEELLQSVFPIVQLEEDESYSIAGISVLIELFNHPFLVTAGHVLKDNGNENPIFLLTRVGK